MFFQEQIENQQINIEEKIIRDLNYSDFQKLFHEMKTDLKGYGIFSIKNNEGNYYNYYLIHIHEYVFSIVSETTEEANIENITGKVCKFLLFDTAILKEAKFFTGKEETKTNFYKDFGVEVPIEVKFYNYSEVSKILLSKAGDGNIDLYLEFQFNNLDNSNFKMRITASLAASIKKLKLIQSLNKKF